MYVELHARSAFSFLRGASLPEELVETCASYGMPSMALLDSNGVYGSARFHGAATKLGVKAHIGAEIDFRISEFSDFRISKIPLLVSSRAGYQNLCRLITRMKMRVPKDEP
jgi:error-prone DNA polymerase